VQVDATQQLSGKPNDDGHSALMEEISTKCQEQMVIDLYFLDRNRLIKY